MEFPKWTNIFIALITAELLAVAVFFSLSGGNYFISYPKAALGDLTAIIASPSVSPTPLPPQKLSNPPEIIKAVYVTGYSAGSKKYLKRLADLFKATEINAVVIDIKDYSGAVSYNSGAGDV